MHRLGKDIEFVASPMTYQLPELPYAKDALAPHISAETIEFHYGKHHKTYVDNLNKLLAGNPMADETLEAVVRKAPQGPLFNNAAQVWNHTFYWNSLKPQGGGEPGATWPGPQARPTAPSPSSGGVHAKPRPRCSARAGHGWCSETAS